MPSHSIDPSAALTAAKPTRPIAVFGAYGHTARFVIAELRRRGWIPILCGRDAAQLHATAAAHDGAALRVASIDEPAALDRALAGAAAVINCAGPFAETAPAVLEAALRAGIHYVDVTGEAVVAMTSFAQYAGATPEGDRVRRSGVVVAPALGFYGALGDLLTTAAMADWPSADEITIATALDSWRPTRGPAWPVHAEPAGASCSRTTDSRFARGANRRRPGPGSSRRRSDGRTWWASSPTSMS